LAIRRERFRSIDTREKDIHMADETRILVLEGPLSRGVADLLAAEGWSVTPTTSPSELLAALEGEANLIVLDVLAPGMKLTTWQEVVQSANMPVLVIVPGVEPGR